MLTHNMEFSTTSCLQHSSYHSFQQSLSHNYFIKLLIIFLLNVVLYNSFITPPDAVIAWSIYKAGTTKFLLVCRTALQLHLDEAQLASQLQMSSVWSNDAVDIIRQAWKEQVTFPLIYVVTVIAA